MLTWSLEARIGLITLLIHLGLPAIGLIGKLIWSRGLLSRRSELLNMHHVMYRTDKAVEKRASTLPLYIAPPKPFWRPASRGWVVSRTHDQNMYTTSSGY
jgi:hypothetical protein